jgi:hypothetical protein
MGGYGRGNYGMGGYGMGNYSMGNYGMSGYGMNDYGMAGSGYPQYATMQSQGPGQYATASPALDSQGGIDWPLGLRIMPPWPESQEVREQLDKLLRQVAKQAESGSVDPKVAELAGRQVRRLRRMLDDAETRIPSRTADESRRFLKNLEEKVQLYQVPELPKPAEARPEGKTPSDK